MELCEPMHAFHVEMASLELFSSQPKSFKIYLSDRSVPVCTKLFTNLSYDVASGSEITQCKKICKQLVVYRLSGNVMMSITTLRT